LVVDFGSTTEIAGGERHLAHRVDERNHIMFLDVDMFDFLDEEF
jgi:hypothetical protein